MLLFSFLLWLWRLNPSYSSTFLTNLTNIQVYCGDLRSIKKIVWQGNCSTFLYPCRMTPTLHIKYYFGYFERGKKISKALWLHAVSDLQFIWATLIGIQRHFHIYDVLAPLVHPLPLISLLSDRFVLNLSHIALIKPLNIAMSQSKGVLLRIHDRFTWWKINTFQS